MGSVNFDIFHLKDTLVKTNLLEKVVDQSFLRNALTKNKIQMDSI